MTGLFIAGAVCGLALLISGVVMYKKGRGPLGLALSIAGGAALAVCLFFVLSALLLVAGVD